MVKVLNDAGLSAKVSAPLFDAQYEEYLREKKTHVGGNIFEVCHTTCSRYATQPRHADVAVMDVKIALQIQRLLANGCPSVGLL